MTAGPCFFAAALTFLALVGAASAQDPAGDGDAAVAPTATSVTLAPGVQAMSLLGEPLSTLPLSAEERAHAQAALDKARQAYAEQPDSVPALIAVGRCLSGLGQYREAVALYTQGLAQHADDPHLLRHRGHRFITLRQFPAAVADLARAAELVRGQPDEDEGPPVPDPKDVVLDTFHENVFYHLALAHYLQHQDESALAAWKQCAACVKNDDGRVMVAHWLYLTLHRLGRDEEAQQAIAGITPEMHVVEYHAYHDAVLVYRGLKSPDAVLAPLSPTGPTSKDFATVGYGIACWQRFQGRSETGLVLLRQVAGAEMWPAFGRIAAEADLLRMQQDVLSEPIVPVTPPAR